LPSIIQKTPSKENERERRLIKDAKTIGTIDHWVYIEMRTGRECAAECAAECIGNKRRQRSPVLTTE